MANPAAPIQLPFQLRSVYLSGGQIILAPDFDPTLPGQPLVGKFRIVDGNAAVKKTLLPGQSPDVMDTCVFKTKFEFRYIRALDNGDAPPESEEEARLASSISAEISVDYLLTSSDVPSKEALEGIAKSNVLVHIWPYWREYCHSTLARMNLPVTLMPLFFGIAPTSEEVGPANSVLGTASKTKPQRRKSKKAIP
jgi:hypothetical protein